MVDTKYSELIAQYLSENISVQNKEKLMAWIKASPANQNYFDDLKEIWQLSENYDDQFDPDINVAWDKFEQLLPIEEEEKEVDQKGKVIHLRRKWWSVAATIALLISIGGYWWWNNPITEKQLVVITTDADQKEHTLPDGSKVWLNSQTKLSYEASFLTRAVSLEGEAFFDIVKKAGQNFQITSGNALTTVLGTSFNVRAYPTENRVEVTVETGIVELKEAKKESNKVKIPAGRSGFYEKQTQRTIVEKAKDLNAQAWKTKALNFDGVSMESVITALERYFDIEIQVENEAIYKCSLNGTYPNPDLDQIISILGFAIGLEIEVENDIHLFKGKGCLN